MNKKERNEESKKNKEFFEAVKLLSKDTGVTVDAMCESIQNVLIGALKRNITTRTSSSAMSTPTRASSAFICARP